MTHSYVWHVCNVTCPHVWHESRAIVEWRRRRWLRRWEAGVGWYGMAMTRLFKLFSFFPFQKNPIVFLYLYLLDISKRSVESVCEKIWTARVRGGERGDGGHQASTKEGGKIKTRVSGYPYVCDKNLLYVTWLVDMWHALVASRMWVRHRSVVIVEQVEDSKFRWDAEMCLCFIHVTFKLVSGTTQRSVIESCIHERSVIESCITNGSFPPETVGRENFLISPSLQPSYISFLYICMYVYRYSYKGCGVLTEMDQGCKEGDTPSVSLAHSLRLPFSPRRWKQDWI